MTYAAITRAVRFDRYGTPAELYVASVPTPAPGAGEALVELKASGIHAAESAIRRGDYAAVFPVVFPSGQGVDVAGVVVAVGQDVTTVAVGDEVLGWGGSTHATYVVVPVAQLVQKPEQLSWEVAGALYGVGVTAYAAVHAVDPQPGDTVVVSAAAGGVGSLVVQLLVRRGARVLGIASESNDEWLVANGVEPVRYAEAGGHVGLADLVRQAAPTGVDAFIDTFGADYLDLAVDLGVLPDRIESVAAAEKAAELGAKSAGSADASTPEILSELAQLVASGAITVPVAAIFPFSKVRAAYEQVDRRHTRGKIVLVP